MGSYRDNGKENGKYYIVYWGNIRISTMGRALVYGYQSLSVAIVKLSRGGSWVGIESAVIVSNSSISSSSSRRSSSRNSRNPARVQP